MRKNIFLALLLIVAVIFVYNCTSEGEANVTVNIDWHYGGKTKAEAKSIDDQIYADPAAVAGSSTAAANDPDPDLMHAGWFTFTIDEADIGNILNFIIKDCSSPVSIALFNSSDNLVSLYQYDATNLGCDAVFGLVDQGTVYLWIGPENDTPGQDVTSDVTFKLSTGTYKGPDSVALTAKIDFDTTKTPLADLAHFTGARFFLFNPFEAYYGASITPQGTPNFAVGTSSNIWTYTMDYDFAKGGTYEMTAIISCNQTLGEHHMQDGSLFYGNSGETKFNPINGCFVLDAFDVAGGTTGYDFSKTTFTLSEIVYPIYKDTYPSFTTTSNLDFHQIPVGLLNGVIDGITTTSTFQGVVSAPAGSDYNFDLPWDQQAAGKGFVTTVRKDTSYSLAQLAKMYPGKVRPSRTVGLR